MPTRPLPFLLALVTLGACQHPPAAPAPAVPATMSPPPALDAGVVEPPADVPPVAVDVPATYADVALRALAPVRPCAVEVEPAGDAGAPNDCVELERVRPEGGALRVCFDAALRLRFSYDAAGRIVESPTAAYRHQPNGAVVRTGDTGSATLGFDAAGRIVRENGVRTTYTPDGRIARREGRGRYVEYVYQPDGTYTTRHNYPDRDEFCLADLVEVRVDAQGRPVLDRYDHCGINEVPRTLRMTYGNDDRIERIEVDLQSDGTTEGTLHLHYLDAYSHCPGESMRTPGW